RSERIDAATEHDVPAARLQRGSALQQDGATAIAVTIGVQGDIDWSVAAGRTDGNARIDEYGFVGAEIVVDGAARGSALDRRADDQVATGVNHQVADVLANRAERQVAGRTRINERNVTRRGIGDVERADAVRAAQVRAGCGF